jgi:dTDP-glucose 4,6-dehydratase
MHEVRQGHAGGRGEATVLRAQGDAVAKSFLVIGHTSFYGSNFVRLLESKGCDVETMSLRTWEPDRLKGQDYVVNFAAANIVAESWKQSGEYCLVNVVAHTELIEKLRHEPIKKYVHVSTPEVYGSVDAWVNEEQRFNPSTPYAVSRAATDMMLVAYWNAYKFPAVITRTANIYGPGQPENRIVTQALKRKKAGATLPLDGGGNTRRCFIHVRDACEATYLAAVSGKPGETYHVSGWTPLSIRQLVEKIGCKWEETPERLGKDYAYMLDSTKIRKLGWQDKINLEEGLAECESANQ